jgi:hypothetical protein
MKLSKGYNLIGVIIAGLMAWGILAYPVLADTIYVSQAVVVSADLLSGSSVASITNFHYNITSLPATSMVRIQFSKDNASWYSADGTLGAWTTISTIGGADLSLAAFVAATSWTSGNGFYYKLELDATTLLTGTPVMGGVRLDYSPVGGSQKTFVFDNNGNVGVGTTAPAYNLDIATAMTGGRGMNIANTAAAGTNYGVYSAASGASATNYGGYFQAIGAAMNYGLGVAPMTGNTSTGLDIGALSGALTNTGINIGNISGGTLNNYGINLGTLTGGAGSSGYQIKAGNIVAVANGSWGGINLGSLMPTAGVTTYGINIGNTLAGAGLATYGINIGTNASTATNNFGMKIGAISGAGTTNTGLYIDTVSGAANNYAAIFAGGNVGIGTASPLGKLDVSGSSASTDSTVFVGARAFSIINTDTTANNMSGIDFRTNDASSTITTGAKIMGVYTSHTANAVSGDLTFLTRNAGTISEKMRILSSGNVGIGTASPGARLQVAGVDNSTTTVALIGGLSTTGLVVLNSGNVGIGTTGPAYSLEVLSAGTYSAVFRNGAGGVVMGSATVGVAGDAVIGSYASTGGIALKVGNGLPTTGLYIQNNGNVGIGTTTPTVALDVVGVINASAAVWGNSGGIRLGTYNGFNGLYSSTSDMGFTHWTGSAYRTDMVIKGDSGNVGIGTTSPLFKLDVSGTMRVTATSTFAGNVGIGTTTPAYALDVKATGASGVVARFNNDNTGCSFNGDGTISCSSDARLKKNIEDINYGLNEIMALRPVAFNWNTQADGSAKSLGFIAQEVETVLPKLVMTDPSNGYKELNTIGMVPVLAKAIQEQQAEIADLELKLTSSGLINASTTAQIGSGSNGIVEMVRDAVISLFQAGIDGIKNFAADNIKSKNVTTDQMCIAGSDGETICLTKDQLKEMIKNTGAVSTITKTYAPVSDENSTGTVGANGVSNTSASTVDAAADVALPSGGKGQGDEGTTGHAATTGNIGSGTATTAEITPEQAATIVNQIAAETATTTAQ